MLTLYTKTGCVGCERLKRALSHNDVIYKVMVLDEDCTIEYIKDRFPTATSFPIVEGLHGIMPPNQLLALTISPTELVLRLRSEPARILFVKKSGRERVITCTLDPDRLAETNTTYHHPHTVNKGLVVWDLTKGKWATIGLRRMISIDFLGVDYTP